MNREGKRKGTLKLAREDEAEPFVINAADIPDGYGIASIYYDAKSAEI